MDEDIDIELPFPGAGTGDGELSTNFLNMWVMLDSFPHFFITHPHLFWLRSAGTNSRRMDYRTCAVDSGWEHQGTRASWRLICEPSAPTKRNCRGEWPSAQLLCGFWPHCCKKLVPTPRCMHRGPKTRKPAKSKSMKQSAQRVEEIFNSTSRPNIPHLPICLPTQVAPTTLTQSEAILEWVSISFPSIIVKFPDLLLFSFFLDWKAKAILSAHLYVSTESQLQAGRTQFFRALAQEQQYSHQVKYLSRLSFISIFLTTKCLRLGITPSSSPPRPHECMAWSNWSFTVNYVVNQQHSDTCY